MARDRARIEVIGAADAVADVKIDVAAFVEIGRRLRRGRCQRQDNAGKDETANLVTHVHSLVGWALRALTPVFAGYRRALAARAHASFLKATAVRVGTALLSPRGEGALSDRAFAHPTVLFLARLISRHAFHLVEPVEAHLLHDAIAHHDQPRLLGGEMLVHGEGRDVDEVAALPFEALGHLRPFPLEFVGAVEGQVPVQIIAGALGHEDHLFPHVPVLAGMLGRLEELHIGLDAAFARVEATMHHVLDQAVGRMLPRHVLGFHDVGAVSYTHLDVYKRQHQMRSSFSRFIASKLAP